MNEIHVFLGQVVKNNFMVMITLIAVMMATMQYSMNNFLNLNRKNVVLCSLCMIVGSTLILVYRPINEPGYTPGVIVGILMTVNASFQVGGLFAQYYKGKKNKS